MKSQRIEYRGLREQCGQRGGWMPRPSTEDVLCAKHMDQHGGGWGSDWDGGEQQSEI